MDMRQQAVTGVVPPELAEARIRECYPSVARNPAVARLGQTLMRTIVLASLALRAVWREMPPFAEEVLRVLIVIPALRLVAPVVGEDARAPIFALAGFYLVDRARVLLYSAPLFERLLFCAEMAAACAVLGWLLRPARVRELPSGAIGGLAWLGHGVRVALLLCALALVAGIVVATRSSIFIARPLAVGWYIRTGNGGSYPGVSSGRAASWAAETRPYKTPARAIELRTGRINTWNTKA